MSKMIPNHTAGLRRTITVATPAGRVTATITRIGPASMGKDGRYWSMVYGTTDRGPIAFASVNDGPPAWMC